MPGVGIFISAPDLAAEKAFLEHIQQRLQHLEEPMRMVTGLFAHAFSEGFSASGPGWVPLSPATVEKKARLGLDSRILHATGDLAARASSHGSWDVRATSDGAEAQFADPTGYGHFHITGTRFMPARDWGFVSDDTLGASDQVFLDWPLLEGA